MTGKRLQTVAAILALSSAFIVIAGCQGGQHKSADPGGGGTPREPLSLEQLKRDTFRYFWETTDPNTGLAPDRHPSESPASIAAMGFALTAYGIGADNGYITREQAAERALSMLRFVSELPQGPSATEAAGYQGFFYHFLDGETGLRSQDWQIELSTVDTALLMAGVLFAQSYFDGADASESEIRLLADNLYRAVNWQWAQNNYPLITLGWLPESGFLDYDWVGYNEAMIVYILALGSPTYPVEPEAWTAWTDHYADDWGGAPPYEHLTFGPLFGHQYTHVWIDFRGIRDDYMASKDTDYFLNSRTATYAQRQYAIENPMGWTGYSAEIWGVTACDGPGEFMLPFNGEQREFRAYSARGVAGNHGFDDGTIAPTAAGGSIAFAPEIAVPALRAIYDNYGDYLYGDYGFRDAFNPSFRYDVQPVAGRIINGVGWVGADYIGIDQGAILAMAENYETELVWNIMKNNPYVRAGLERAGFTGGWLSGTGGSE